MEKTEAIEKGYKDFDLLELSPEILREQTLHILKIPSHLRTPEDQKVVEDYMTHTGLFKSFVQEDGPEKFAGICANLTYCYLPPNQTLFEQGSTGTACYIILEGTADLLINIKDSDEIKTMKVAEIGAGMIFGETALLDKSKRMRTATVKANENPCHLASLEKDAFTKVLDQFGYERELKNQIRCLETFPFFKSLNLTSEQYLKRFVLQCDKRAYPMGSVIYQEGEPCEDIYLLKSGELRSTKLIQVKDSAGLTTKKLELATIVPGQLFGDEEALMLHLIRLKESTKDHKYMQTKSPLNDREQFLFELGKLFSQSLENEDVSASQESLDGITYRKNSFSNPEVVRDCTVKVSVKAEIWRIPAQFFFKLLDMNLEAYQFLLAKLEQSRERREERLPSIANNSRSITAKGGSRKQKLIQLQNDIGKSFYTSSSESSPVKHSS